MMSGDYTVTKEIDCLNQNCPMPLIKTREAVNSSSPGDVVKIYGDHPQSFEEIPMALDALEIEILEKVKNEDSWYIVFKL